MNGTEWTEPGQGATVGELRRWAGTEIGAAHWHLREWLKVKATLSSKRGGTNLRLTGSPLTADDLKRIEECEVTR